MFQFQKDKIFRFVVKQILVIITNFIAFNQNNHLSFFHAIDINNNDV
jgi:hypothetical protein